MLLGLLSHCKTVVEKVNSSARRAAFLLRGSMITAVDVTDDCMCSCIVVHVEVHVIEASHASFVVNNEFLKNHLSPVSDDHKLISYSAVDEKIEAIAVYKGNSQEVYKLANKCRCYM